MRLNPTVLSILAGTLAGAALTGCGASQSTESNSTARTETEAIEAPPATAVSSTSPTTETLPASNGPQSEEEFPLDCGRG